MTHASEHERRRARKVALALSLISTTTFGIAGPAAILEITGDVALAGSYALFGFGFSAFLAWRAFNQTRSPATTAEELLAEADRLEAVADTNGWWTEDATAARRAAGGIRAAVRGEEPRLRDGFHADLPLSRREEQVVLGLSVIGLAMGLSSLAMTAWVIGGIFSAGSALLLRHSWRTLRTIRVARGGQE